MKKTRIPKIDIVSEGKTERGIISYRVLDNDKEDLIHIRDILFNKFKRSEFKEHTDIFYIEDILECIKIQINNRENYNEIKEQFLHTLLLDSITNNADRHPNNWGLVRDKRTNMYELADFDHSSAFVDMIEEKPHFTLLGWTSSYVTVYPEKSKTEIGSDGEKIIKYIFEKYPSEFCKFSEILKQNLEEILNDIEKEEFDLSIDRKRLIQKLSKRSRMIQKMISKEEVEYEQ